MKIQFIIIILIICFIQKTFSQNTADSSNTIIILNDSVLIINDKITINANERTISFPALIHKTSGPIEVVLCTKKGKAYECLLTTEVTPVELQTALLLLGYKSLENKLSDKNEIGKLNKTDSVYLYMQWADSNGIHENRVENYIWDIQNNSLLKPVSWFFNGLLTDKNGNIIGNEMISMIVTNYDYTSILSMNKNVIFNNSISGVHINSGGEGTYAASTDVNLLGKEIYLIIKPADEKISYNKIKRKIKRKKF